MVRGAGGRVDEDASGKSMTARKARCGKLTFLLMLAWAVSAEAQSEYRMLVNHGAGWSDAGDFRTLEECNREAASYASKYSVQAGCAPVSALEQQRRALEQQRADAQFQQTAAECAKRTRVRIIQKPDANISILGTLEQ